MEKDKLDGITHSNSEELSDFLEEICQSIKNGDTISPFLGSGISAPSGIIMGKDFECFLAHTMRLFFEEGWNIKERGWPEYPNKAEVDKAQRYLCRKYKQILKKSYSQKVRTSSNLVEKVLNKSDSNNRRKVPETDSPLDLFRPLIPRVIRAAECRESESRIEKIRQRLGIPNEPIDPNLSTTSPAYVEETAIRSLQDWTLTLQFFSRFFPVTTEVRGKQHLYYKEDEDLSIIDTFNAHITDGSRPNLIHNMIARLARTLRIQLILSTNFDTLIEQSYRRLQEPLTSIAVSVKGGLPAPSTVRSQPTMIKLHGELCETRADPSISSPPSKHDKEKFFNYLRGDVNMDMTPGYPRSNLLVIGYSASDPRCVQMIQHVLDLDPEFKVFWICHHESDLDHINGIFDSSRLRTIVHPRSDLILWELYQILNLSLPSGGFTFQLSHDIPPEPLTNSEAADGRFNEELENIATEIRKKTKGKFFAVDCPSGINYTFRRGFNDLVAQGYQCIWLEGESLATPRHFLYILLQGISLRIGKFQLEWVSLLPTNFWSEEHWENGLYAHLDSLMTHFRLDPTKWFLFIYERSGAGASSGLQLNYWTEQQYEDMNKILSNLSSLGFRVIYLVFGKLRSSRNLEKSENLAKFIRKAKLPNREVCDIQREVIDETYNDWFRKEYREQLEDYSSRLQKITPIIVPCNSRPIKSPFPKQRFPDKSFESIIERVGSKMMGLQDSDTDNSSLYLWLYGVTLFRQSRHTNALISEAIFPCPHRFNIEGRDNDIERHKIVFSKKSGWLPELAGEGVFYRKPGGYTWKYNDMRLGLQYFLESISEVKVPKGNKGEFVKVYSLWHLRPRIHFWIGDWYIRAFYATGHYSPVCETIHHSIQALMLSRYYLPAHEGVEDNSKSRAVFFARLRLGLRSINQARLILSLGTNSLKFWCAGSDLRQTNFFCRNEGTEITSYLESIRLDFKINGTKIYGRYGIEDSVIFTKFMNQWQCLIQDFDRVIDEVSSEGRIESVNGMSSVEQTVSGSRVNEPYLSQNWELIASSSWRNELDSDLSDCLENNRKVLKKFFSKLEAQNSSWLTGKWSRNLVEIWLSGFKGRDGDLINLIQIMLGYSLHYFNRGEYFLLDRQHSWQSVITSVEDVAKRYWSTASAFSYLTLDLCRYISCESLEQMSKFRFRALTTYSLCLSKLSRFQESHRRLNEAHAFLSRGECRFNDSDLARVNLVRSGVYMDQCINRMVNRHQKERVEIAECYPFLGDCWVSIERAEHVMSGKVHSSSLWFQLVEAKLKCYALSGLLLERRECRESERRCNSILFRKRVDKPSLLLGLLRRGLLLSEGCVYRQSLLFLYFCFSAFNVKPDELEMLISVVRAWHNDEISPVVGDLEKSISDLNSGENPFERRKIDDVVSRVLDRFNTGRNPSGDLPTN